MSDDKPRRDRGGVSTPDPRFNRFAEAYLAMATRARYRPAAPNDGFGTVCLTAGELRNKKRLYQEARAYAARFCQEDDKCQFWIGCTDFATNKASVYVIEAARLLCAGAFVDLALVLKLLTMACNEIDEVEREDHGRRRARQLLDDMHNS